MRKFFITERNSSMTDKASDNCLRKSMTSCLRPSYSFFDMVIVSSMVQKNFIFSTVRNAIAKIYSQSIVNFAAAE